jgi:hypothetical protein
MEKVSNEILELEKAQEAASFNAEELIKVTAELEAAKAKHASLEEEWLSKCD